MKTQTATLLLASALLFSAFSLTSCNRAGKPYYDLNSDGESYSLIRTDSLLNTDTATRFTVKEKYRGKPVTGLGELCFAHYYYLTDVTIPDCITDIGDRAFLGCRSLTEITLPQSLKNYGDLVFKACDALKKIEISQNSANFTSIDGVLYSKDGERLVQYPNAKENTSFTLPDSVRSIENYAFLDAGKVKEITVPDSVTTVGEEAFSTSSIANITLGKGITRIESGTFTGCASLTTVVLPETLTCIGTIAFQSCSSLTEISIPDEVSTIEMAAFAGCDSLTSLKLPEKLTEIGEVAFSNCRSLTEITLPRNIASIGDEAFKNCFALKDLHFDGTKEEWNNVEKAENWAFGVSGYTVHCSDGDIVSEN